MMPTTADWLSGGGVSARRQNGDKQIRGAQRLSRRGNGFFRRNSCKVKNVILLLLAIFVCEVFMDIYSSLFRHIYYRPLGRSGAAHFIVLQNGLRLSKNNFAIFILSFSLYDI
jgi:hypothetical protein